MKKITAKQKATKRKPREWLRWAAVRNKDGDLEWRSGAPSYLMLAHPTWKMPELRREHPDVFRVRITEIIK